jgi:hypothetical protein
MRKSLSILVLAAFAVPLTYAQAPSILSFQGRLTDSGGTPVDTSAVRMNFKLYRNGSPIWQETHLLVPVVGGEFNILLGESSRLDTLAFRYPFDLGITIGDDPEIAPRTPLVAAPYALALPGFHTFVVDESSGVESVNIVGGSRFNHVGPDVTGATISGGGSYLFTDHPNVINADFGTISGGYANSIADTAISAAIGGGTGNSSEAPDGAICGGSGNETIGRMSAICGGWQNSTIGAYSAIGGGHLNAALASYASIGGGGRYNGSRTYGNVAYDDYSTIAGGADNTAGTDNSNPNDGAYSAIGGGSENFASGRHATVAGGDENTASGQQATVAGGVENSASALRATIGGGLSNHAGGIAATVSGGSSNRADGDGSMVPGGGSNRAFGAFSFAAGNHADAQHDGSFVWADSSSSSFFSTTGDHQFLVRAVGGVGIGTNAPANQLSVDGAVNITGKLGIATEAPEANLHIDGANGSGLGIRLESYNHDLLNMYYSGETGFVIDSYRVNDGRRLPLLLQPAGGKVGIGTSTPGFLLEVNGDAGKPGGGSWSVASDRRLKDVEKTFDRSLEAIENLKPVVYHYKKDNAAGLPSDVSYVGLIAQDVETSIPEAVSSDDSGYLHLNNDPIIWTMLNAINDLREENERQRQQIEELRAKMENLSMTRSRTVKMR